MLFYSLFATAQNDLCAGATTLTPSATMYSTQGSFSGSSLDGTASACAPNTSQDVWYKFVATDQTMYVEVYNATNIGLDVAMEIYNGDCSGTLLVCKNSNNATQGYESYFGNNFVVGQTYYIRILNASANFSASNFNIGVQKFPTPANDLCTSATTIVPSTTFINNPGSFSGTALDGSASTCAPAASQDLWYNFVATDRTMLVQVSNATNIGLDVAMEIYTTSCNGSLLTCLNNTNATQGYESYFSNSFVVGQTYYVRILNTSANLSIQNFNIGVQKFPTPSNDLCSGAITIVPSATFINNPGSFAGTFLEGNASACAPAASQDLWYKFVATDRTMLVEVNNPINIGLDVAMEIYNTDCNGSLFTCLNNANATQGYELYFGDNFVVGQTYYIRILNTSSNLSIQNFNVGVQKFPAPSNDLCTAATTLTPATTCVTTRGTFSGASLDGTVSSCASSASQDVWYKFVATDQTMYVEVSNAINIGLDVAMEIYSDGCNGSVLACVNNANATQGYESYSYNNYVVGQTYLVRVLNTSASLSTQNFNVCVQGELLNTDTKVGNSISIAPNPVTDVLKISNLDNFSNYTYQIINLQGQQVANGKLSNEVIHTEQLSKGLYILMLSDFKKEFVSKFIKN